MSLVSVATTATTSTVKLIHGSITVDLLQAFNMQRLHDSIINANPVDPNCTITQIQIPFINLNFKDIGIINPISDIKAAISRLYSALMRELLKPIWDILKALVKALEKFISIVVDLTLPILNLQIDDLFSSDLYDRIKLAITNLYYKEKQKIIDILNKLNIPYPFFKDFTSIEKEIEHLVDKIMHSLWDSLFKTIFKIINAIETALTAFDLATYGIPTLSTIWSKIKQAILQEILQFLESPPSIADLDAAIKKFVEAELKKAENTYYEIMQKIKDFKLPIFGSPFDWHLPLNIKVNIPNLDYDKLLNDIKIWINSFLVQLISKFMQLIDDILKVFGLTFVIPKITIPFILMESCQEPITINQLQFA